MTIDEFFVAQHAINDGNFLPSDMHTGKDFEQARESEHVRQWVLGVAEKYGMDNCDCLGRLHTKGMDFGSSDATVVMVIQNRRLDMLIENKTLQLFHLTDIAEWPGFPRPNSYQRRRARKPWLYKGAI